MSKRLSSDQDLIDLYLEGDHSAFEILINRYKERLFTYILITVHDRHLTEDLFQDTFIKVINTLRTGNYNDKGKFYPWVKRIAHNLIIDHFRIAKRIPIFESKNEEFDIFDTIKIIEDCAEDAMITQQIHKDVRKLIDYLPEEQRDVVIMRHYGEMSFSQIAEETDISINTALGRMRYALNNLRKLIKEHNVILTN
jgi:RNA polymerase sigma-70 factor (ECF subfamily)